MATQKKTNQPTTNTQNEQEEHNTYWQNKTQTQNNQQAIEIIMNSKRKHKHTNRQTKTQRNE